VPTELLGDDSLYPVLGKVLGRRAGAAIAVLDGLPTGLSEDRLKALGAAAASSGSVALFDAVGSTPEAPTLDVAVGSNQPEATDRRLRVVSSGFPPRGTRRQPSRDLPRPRPGSGRGLGTRPAPG